VLQVSAELVLLPSYMERLLKKIAWALGKQALTVHSTFAMIYRITESQNSRGWKGPLWVI